MEKKDAMEYILIQAPSWTQSDYELAGEYEGVLSDSPINLVFLRAQGLPGYVKARTTSGGSYVQEFNPDGTPATLVRAYRRKETECFQCGGPLGEVRKEVKHFHNSYHHGSGCLGHPVCSETCEGAFVQEEQAKFPPPPCGQCGKDLSEETGLCPVCDKEE